jgi:serpin B
VTRGKIEQMLSADAVSAATIMVLANAAYFKGKWLNQFKKSDTEPAAFILDNASRDMITVPTMKLTDTFLPVGESRVTVK